MSQQEQQALQVLKEAVTAGETFPTDLIHKLIVDKITIRVHGPSRLIHLDIEVGKYLCGILRKAPEIFDFLATEEGKQWVKEDLPRLLDYFSTLAHTSES